MITKQCVCGSSLQLDYNKATYIYEDEKIIL